MDQTAAIRSAVALFKEAAERFAEAGRPRDEARCLAAADGH